jgi:purine-binding chemotaxis protein CheW
MKPTQQVVIFAVDDQRLALPLSAVERVVQAVEITPLPKAPAVVWGIINVQGQILPVFHLRRRFRWPERELALNDHILIARTAQRRVALVVDAVAGVLECAAEDTVAPDAVVPGLEYVAGIMKQPDGMIFIHDLEKFLSLGEAQQLEAALAS